MSQELETVLARMPRFGPTGWRCDSGFWQERGTTAADVVLFERDELGNDDINPPPAVLVVLAQEPAEAVIWVTETEQQARRYGQHPRQVALGPDPVILAEDGDHGFLIWLRGVSVNRASSR